MSATVFYRYICNATRRIEGSKNSVSQLFRNHNMILELQYCLTFFFDHKRSRFEKDHDVKKDRNEGKIIQGKAQRRPSRLTSDTVQLDQKEYKQWINRVSFCDSKTVNDSWKTTNVGPRSDDKYVITGTRVSLR